MQVAADVMTAEEKAKQPKPKADDSDELDKGEMPHVHQ
jgi:hypothetical protein